MRPNVLKGGGDALKGCGTVALTCDGLRASRRR